MADEPSAKRVKADEEQAGDEAAVNLEQSAIDEQLKVIKEQLNKLNEEASDKVLEIEQQYSKKRRPIYDQRNEVLKMIPSFWQTTLMKHKELNRLATEDDAAILGYCTEINVEDHDDIKSGYRITMRFSENPYFSNEELSKNFSYQEGGVLKVETKPAQWKEGYEPPENDAQLDLTKRDRIPEYRLFEWFTKDDEPSDTPAQVDEIADIFREDIWPDPMRYYEGELELSEDEPLEGEVGEFEEFDEEGEEGGEGMLGEEDDELAAVEEGEEDA